jgi:oxygen-independent coproporphyrinogen-3 oxidase
MNALSDVHSLYVHIPFCERKCEYCDFTSVAGLKREREYVDALRSELQTLGHRFPGLGLDTVFVGGGTPSLIEPESLAAILGDVKRLFDVAPDAEITMEANPSSTSYERAVTWKEAGFNRISIGVQSLEPDVLRFLGRVHDAPRALAAIDEVRAAGFTSINCDLIYAVPGLGDQRWRRTLGEVVAAAPSHVSCYELTVEPGTPLHISVQRGRVTPVAPDRALRQHRIAVDTLAAAGYEQYEVSNFAYPGQRSRHNLVYWRNGYYLAAGVGAHGHLPASAAAAIGVDAGPGAVAIRYWHVRGIDSYISAHSAGVMPIAGSESTSAITRERERLMLGLRLTEGVPVTDARVLTAVAELTTCGLLERDGDRVRASTRGEQVLNQLALRLTEAVAA